MKEIELTIREFITRELKPEVPLENTSLLIQQGIIDSLAIFTLIGFIEENFGVKIDPENVTLDNFETINSIKDLILLSKASK